MLGLKMHLIKLCVYKGVPLNTGGIFLYFEKISHTCAYSPVLHKHLKGLEEDLIVSRKILNHLLQCQSGNK
jgi:hypothetical protein